MAGASCRASGAGHSLPCRSRKWVSSWGSCRRRQSRAGGSRRRMQAPAAPRGTGHPRTGEREQPPPQQLFWGEQTSVEQQYQRGAGARRAGFGCLRVRLSWLLGGKEQGWGRGGLGRRRDGGGEEAQGKKHSTQSETAESGWGGGRVRWCWGGHMGTAQRSSGPGTGRAGLPSLARRGQAPLPPVLKTQVLPSPPAPDRGVNPWPRLASPPDGPAGVQKPWKGSGDHGKAGKWHCFHPGEVTWDMLLPGRRRWGWCCPCLSPNPPQAALGLRHHLPHGEEGGVGEQGVHVQGGVQRLPSPSWSLPAVPCLGLGARDPSPV